MRGAKIRTRRRGDGRLLLWIAGAIAGGVLVSAGAAIVSAVASSAEKTSAPSGPPGDPRAYEQTLAEDAARRFYDVVIQRRFEAAAELASGPARDEQLQKEWARAQDVARDPDLAATIDGAMRATLVSFDPTERTIAPDGTIEIRAHARVRREREHERTPGFRVRRNDQGVWLVDQYRP